MSDEQLHPPYWWCLTHKRVEGRDGCANTDRLGPFDDYEDAANAIERARQRTEAWDNDPRWNDDPSS
jgi:hypothetical protein